MRAGDAGRDRNRAISSGLRSHQELMMRARSIVPSAAAGLLLAATMTSPAEGDATATLASWQLNERAGATVMRDSSGHGINGSIGSDVVTGVTPSGATGYRFTNVDPDQPPVKPGRLVQVNSATLNPGSRDYAVTVRYRTTHTFGNLLQKGQAGAKGGYFKLQAPRGIMHCLFRGSHDSIAVGSGKPLNDGRWHVVRCERSSGGVTMTVDGKVTGSHTGSTGSISNPVPLTIGGKRNCDQVRVSCDYFAGDVDYVTIQTG
jgi:Laminin G domain